MGTAAAPPRSGSDHAPAFRTDQEGMSRGHRPPGRRIRGIRVDHPGVDEGSTARSPSAPRGAERPTSVPARAKRDPIYRSPPSESHSRGFASIFVSLASQSQPVRRQGPSGGYRRIASLAGCAGRGGSTQPYLAKPFPSLTKCQRPGERRHDAHDINPVGLPGLIHAGQLCPARVLAGEGVTVRPIQSQKVNAKTTVLFYV